MRSTFIKFTSHEDENPIWINIELVQCFNADLYKGTAFYYECGKRVTVVESLAEVEERLLKVSR